MRTDAKATAIVFAVTLVACGQQSGGIVEWGAVEPCNLAEAACRWQTPQGATLQLAFPSGVKVLEPFAVIATLDTLPADKVAIEFTMIGMEMGENRYSLRHEGGAWQTHAIIPLCITGRSDWNARLLIQQGEKIAAVDFPFVLQK
jgi:hypothetical protein